MLEQVVEVRLRQSEAHRSRKCLAENVRELSSGIIVGRGRFSEDFEIVKVSLRLSLKDNLQITPFRQLLKLYSASENRVVKRGLYIRFNSQITKKNTLLLSSAEIEIRRIGHQVGELKV